MGDYHTRAVGVVAALKLAGIDPTGIGEDGRGKRVFYFDRTPELTQALDSLFDGSMVVPIRDFLAVQHEIRKAHIRPR